MKKIIFLGFLLGLIFWPGGDPRRGFAIPTTIPAITFQVNGTYTLSEWTGLGSGVNFTVPFPVSVTITSQIQGVPPGTEIGVQFYPTANGCSEGQIKVYGLCYPTDESPSTYCISAQTLADNGQAWRALPIARFGDGQQHVLSGQITITFQRIMSMPELKMIKVTSPAANAAFSAGQAIPIRWTSTGTMGSSVRIRLVPEVEPQAAQVIVASTANDGVYDWTTATAFPGQVRIEVQTTDGAVTGKSGLFTISPAQPQGNIFVTRPFANSAYSVGQSVPIAWNCTGNPGSSVRIRVVPQDAPQNAQVIADSTPNDGAHSWTATAALMGRLRIEVQSLSGQIKGQSGVFTVSPAGTRSYTFPVNHTFHGGAWGEFCDGVQYLGNGFTVHGGSKLTVRKNLTITPAGFSFVTWATFPNNGCPHPENEGKVNGSCYPLYCGNDPAVKEQVFSAQFISENGTFMTLRLLLHGTSNTVTDYQISGNVEVTITD